MRHKILRDFEIQTNHPNSARKPDFVLINKKKELVIYWNFHLIPSVLFTFVMVLSDETWPKKKGSFENLWTLLKDFLEYLYISWDVVLADKQSLS